MNQLGEFTKEDQEKLNKLQREVGILLEKKRLSDMNRNKGVSYKLTGPSDLKSWL